MKREIVFDTETTGFDPFSGDRIVEIGCVELINYVPTGRTYQTYLNPERKMSIGASQVSGIQDDFLLDKPKFNEIVDDFLDFVGDAVLIAHNAEFDMKFVNWELKNIEREIIPWERVIDTLAISRKKFPGAKATLDALCDRFSVDRSRRERHGALLDSELLTEVYIELCGGKEPSFILNTSQGGETATQQEISKETKVYKQRTYTLSSTDKEKHQSLLKKITNALWEN